MKGNFGKIYSRAPQRALRWTGRQLRSFGRWPGASLRHTWDSLGHAGRFVRDGLNGEVGLLSDGTPSFLPPDSTSLQRELSRPRLINAGKPSGGGARRLGAWPVEVLEVTGDHSHLTFHQAHDGALQIEVVEQVQVDFYANYKDRGPISQSAGNAFNVGWGGCFTIKQELLVPGREFQVRAVMGGGDQVVIRIRIPESSAEVSAATSEIGVGTVLRSEGEFLLAEIMAKGQVKVT